MIVSRRMIEAVTTAATPTTWNTRLSPAAADVTPAAGPMIDIVRTVSLSSSWPAVSVIVCAVAKTVGSKVIVVAGELTLARLMASRRVRSPAGDHDRRGWC